MAICPSASIGTASEQMWSLAVMLLDAAYITSSDRMPFGPSSSCNALAAGQPSIHLLLNVINTSIRTTSRANTIRIVSPELLDQQIGTRAMPRVILIGILLSPPAAAATNVATCASTKTTETLAPLSTCRSCPSYYVKSFAVDKFIALFLASSEHDIDISVDT